MPDADEMTPAQIDAVRSHLENLRPNCPMCGGVWPDTWVLHGRLVYFPALDAAFNPTPGGVPATLLKCRRCRFVAPFRVAGPDYPTDVSSQAPPA